MDRLYGMRLDVAVFTNLSRDHLDFHQDLEDYARAKLKMFTELCDQDSAVIINTDDPLSERIRKKTPGRVTTYGIRTPADVLATTIDLGDQGTALTVQTPVGWLDLRMKLRGEFNVYNTLAALGTGLALGLDTGAMVQALEVIEPVRGRFEPIRSDRGFSVFVDYAHTPDALEKLLTGVRRICKGRLITVFGCGGDRDRGKRPLMGEIATRLADRTIVTSDNPRTEDPNAIIDEILTGIKKGNSYSVEPDRKAAITQAVSEAQKGDMVVIAGKGHEDYQILGTEKIHFDDKETVKALVNK
jgi:UDP-N-acetylmuramoyl-L-alanyl-D-glutamate--2,6-diaminopimelate ligase